MDGIDDATTFTDTSTGGADSPHTATAAGTANTETTDVAPKYGTASAQLNNSGYVGVADSDDWAFGSGDFTIEGWFYLNALAGTYSCWGQWTDSNIEMHGRIDSSGRVIFVCYQYAYLIAVTGSAGAVSAGSWHHIAWVRDGSRGRVYVNGVQVGSSSFSGSVPNFTGLFRVSDSVSYGLFDGYVDDFRISTTCRYPDGTTFTPPTAAFTP